MSQPTLKRTRNFNAGPAGLPLSVLQIAQSEFLNYDNTGMGVNYPIDFQLFIRHS